MRDAPASPSATASFYVPDCRCSGRCLPYGTTKGSQSSGRPAPHTLSREVKVRLAALLSRRVAVVHNPRPDASASGTCSGDADQPDRLADTNSDRSASPCSESDKASYAARTTDILQTFKVSLISTLYSLTVTATHALLRVRPLARYPLTNPMARGAMRPRSGL